MNEMNNPHAVLGAYRVVFRDVAQWRHEALDTHEEFSRRDRFLSELETIARAAAIRLTGSVVPDLSLSKT